jgi:DNA-directed RNA polymerase specialized sigma24 family protein
MRRAREIAANFFPENEVRPCQGPAGRTLLTGLAAARPQAAELLELRFFARVTLEEIAPILDLSPRTARRLWAIARAWLRRDMERSGESAS